MSLPDENLLKEYIERIEYMYGEKSALFGQIKEVFEEAQDKGLNIKALKEVIKLRKLTGDEYKRQESAIDKYKRILGMI